MGLTGSFTLDRRRVGWCGSCDLFVRVPVSCAVVVCAVVVAVISVPWSRWEMDLGFFAAEEWQGTKGHERARLRTTRHD